MTTVIVDVHEPFISSIFAGLWILWPQIISLKQFDYDIVIILLFLFIITEAVNDYLERGVVLPCCLPEIALAFLECTQFLFELDYLFSLSLLCLFGSLVWCVDSKCFVQPLNIVCLAGVQVDQVLCNACVNFHVCFSCLFVGCLTKCEAARVNGYIVDIDTITFIAS